MQIDRLESAPIPPTEIPDPPAPAPGLRDRERWTEVTVEGVGRVYVVAYCERAQIAALWCCATREWQTVHGCTPGLAAELPERLAREFVAELGAS